MDHPSALPKGKDEFSEDEGEKVLKDIEQVQQEILFNEKNIAKMTGEIEMLMSMADDLELDVAKGMRDIKCKSTEGTSIKEDLEALKRFSQVVKDFVQESCQQIPLCEEFD